jgi:hypothetical protein
MNPRPASSLDVSPEEEAFLHNTFRRYARSYLAVSVFALGLAIAGLGFGLRNASASDVGTSAIHDRHADQRQQIAALEREIEAQLEASTALTQRLTALEEQLAGLETDPTLETQMDAAHSRIRVLEKKQGGSASPVSAGLYKRLNALEARLSVVELERG